MRVPPRPPAQLLSLCLEPTTSAHTEQLPQGGGPGPAETGHLSSWQGSGSSSLQAPKIEPIFTSGSSMEAGAVRGYVLSC